LRTKLSFLSGQDLKQKKKGDEKREIAHDSQEREIRGGIANIANQKINIDEVNPGEEKNVNSKTVNQAKRTKKGLGRQT